jgi:hypothetical protein
LNVFSGAGTWVARDRGLAWRAAIPHALIASLFFICASVSGDQAGIVAAGLLATLLAFFALVRVLWWRFVVGARSLRVAGGFLVVQERQQIKVAIEVRELRSVELHFAERRPEWARCPGFAEVRLEFRDRWHPDRVLPSLLDLSDADRRTLEGVLREICDEYGLVFSRR